MELFAGTARFRNVMRIRFIDSAEGDGYGYFITDHFDKFMKDLGGFRKLVVEFEAPGNPKLACEEAQVVLRSNCELIKYYKLKHFFEPIYGPGLHGTLRDVTNYTCYLELYPRQHLAKKLIAKAGKTLEEAARLGARELALASLPEIIEKLKLL